MTTERSYTPVDKSPTQFFILRDMGYDGLFLELVPSETEAMQEANDRTLIIVGHVISGELAKFL